MAQTPARDSIFPKKVSLEEVVIKGRKAPLTFQIDRQLYNASAYANALNGNAVELVKNLPGVSLNGQGELQLRGSSSFLVLINGKPAQGDPAFVLSQLPASQILRVEVISSPGAAFDADGKSGILNIITLSAPEKGLLLQSNVMTGLGTIEDFGNQRYTNPRRRSADVAAAWQRGRWDISTGLNYLRNDASGYREGDVYTLRNNIKTAFPSVGERSFRRYNYGGRLSAQYELNPNSQLSFGAYVGKRFQSRVADLLYSNTRTHLQTGMVSPFTYYNKNTADKEGLFSLVSIGGQHKLRAGTGLSYSLQYEGADLDSRTTNENLTAPVWGTMIQETDNPGANTMHAWRAKVDMNRKAGNTTIQGGYQFRYDTQDGIYTYLFRDAGQQAYQTDPAFSSAVRVDNVIHAAYGQLSGKQERLEWQAGLRAEHTQRTLKLANLGDTRRLTLLNLFPSYAFRYAVSETSVWKTTLTRRIKRTNNYELNPMPEREHSETLEQGDPELLPELTAVWELGWEKRLRQGNLFITLYHQQTKNPIQRVNKVFNDTILNRVFTNAGSARQTGMEANLTLRIAKVWDLILGGNLFHYRIDGAIFNGQLPVSNSSWVYSLNITNTVNMGKSWSTQLGVNYLSLRATAQGEDGAFLTPSLTVKKGTKDKRWTFAGQWLFMDAGLGISNRQRISTWGRDFYTTTNYIYEPDQFQLSAGFQLQRRNRKVSLPQSEITEKEF